MAAVPLHLHHDRQRIVTLLRETAGAVLQHSQRQGKAWARFIEPEACCTIFDHLAENESFAELRAVVLNDSHFLVYCVAPMWFAPSSPLLVEQYFARIGSGAADFAFSDIRQLAREQGCVGAVMATMLMPSEEAGERLYRQQGLTRQCSQHFMEIA